MESWPLFVHGEKPTTINAGCWGVWSPRVLGRACILWVGSPLSVEAKLDDSMKRRASLPAAFPGASLLAPRPTCLQLWLRSPSSSPSCHSCQLLSFKAPWTSVQCVISLLHSPLMILLTAPHCPWLTKSLPGMAPLSPSLSSCCRPQWHLPTSLHAVWALAGFRTPVHILLVYILFAGDILPRLRSGTKHRCQLINLHWRRYSQGN